MTWALVKKCFPPHPLPPNPVGQTCLRSLCGICTNVWHSSQALKCSPVPPPHVGPAPTFPSAQQLVCKHQHTSEEWAWELEEQKGSESERTGKGFSFHGCKRVLGTLVTQNTIPHRCTHMHTNTHKDTIPHSNHGIG